MYENGFSSIEISQDYKWAPFGGGQHNCPGRHFAVNQLKYFILFVFHNYDVKGVLKPTARFERLVAKDCYLQVTPKAH